MDRKLFDEMLVAAEKEIKERSKDPEAKKLFDEIQQDISERFEDARRNAMMMALVEGQAWISMRVFPVDDEIRIEFSAHPGSEVCVVPRGKKH